ncbi:metallophosphoesterase family protein [Sphingobium boeckii]|uniref:Putative phosphodiesterase n=1 Tax=Sphingobium boeckii TaxID=1082345 RepID=A0A7W9EDB8_9SPHN|nr:DNA repair exonuclease [Sphingobium boeckii]MBB5684962.1 putative phosphodiesterase [Sphingobium boeckii]
MNDFRFLHAADIHLDSPLRGLSRYEGMPEDEIRSATRAAFDNLIQRAVDEAVDFVLIAGDIFDGDWKDMGTGLYFARAMGRLNQADIPVFLLSGNHDAESVLTRSIPWPPNVRLFGTKRPETHTLPDLAVAVHGQSFATPAVTDNLVLAYPDATDYHFNIGMLHTALAGRQGHAAYAPCSLEDLKSKHYDYWALGHVHEHEIVCEDPHVVFPGNTQGRTIRETGPKGAVIVTVGDAQVVTIERVELDVLRWARVEVDCTDATADAVPSLMRASLLSAWQSNAAGLPLIARVSLTGQTADAGLLHDGVTSLRDDARAVSASISPDLFIERVKVLVAPLAQTQEMVIGDDFASLIGQASTDPTLAALLAEDLAPFLLAAQTALGQSPEDADDEGLRRSASDSNWTEVLETATLALRSRLTGEA